jgi:nitrate reductase gamma subunit
VMYAAKIVKFLKLPRHIRWDLYPIPHEENYLYGGSYYEKQEWWNRPRRRRRMRDFLSLLKDNFLLDRYYTGNRTYWLALYPWHLGFILIISFHIFCFLGALSMLLGLDVSAASASTFGVLAYYIILVTGVASFLLGTIGSIGLLVKRTVSDDLRLYASPLNFFNYLFFLVVFLSGLYSWYFADPTFSEYREYWMSLVALHAPRVHWPTAAHILLFALFLIYLPFTRSMHYISRFLAFFRIQWDDEPNMRGSTLEKKIMTALGRRVTWSASHIQTGKTWAEVAQEVRHPDKKEETTG